MDWNKYQLVLIKTTDGENSIGDTVSFSATHTCEVEALKSLKEGDPVPFEPEHFGCPNINITRLTDEAVELTFHNYTAPNDTEMKERKVVLRPDVDLFYDYEDLGGRYSTEYTMLLKEKK